MMDCSSDAQEEIRKPDQLERAGENTNLIASIDDEIMKRRLGVNNAQLTSAGMGICNERI